MKIKFSLELRIESENSPELNENLLFNISIITQYLKIEKQEFSNNLH